MAKQVPKRLGKEPLIESLFEIRFWSDITSVSSILPGVIYSAYSNRITKTVPLPLAGIIPEIREKDPNLKYAPIVQFSLDPGPYIFQVGDHVASVSCPRPYTGWSEFGGTIREFMGVLEKSKLINNPERFSMKYSDILSIAGAPTVAVLDVDFKLGGRDATSGPVTLRVEENASPFVHIVQIIASVNAQLADGSQLSGILIENDTIFNHAGGNFWTTLDRQLDSMHEFNKGRFFELLKPETLAALEPEYR
jgi:uncharacterized protein (TIGR04255 family)